MIYSNTFDVMTQTELESVEGGSTKIAAGICGIISGVLCVGAGASSLLGWNRVSGWLTIGSGAFATVAGGLALFPAP